MCALHFCVSDNRPWHIELGAFWQRLGAFKGSASSKHAGRALRTEGSGMQLIGYIAIGNLSTLGPIGD